MSRVFFALAVMSCLPGTMCGEDKTKKIDNPEFINWSKFKEGSSVTTKSVTIMGERVRNDVTTCRLLELKKESLVIEVSSEIEVDGKKTKVTNKVDIQRKIDPKDAVPADPKTGKPNGTTEEGEETLTIEKIDYKCRWYKFKQKVVSSDKIDYGDVEGTTWLSQEVPGLVVKSSTKQDIGSQTIEVLKIDIKK